MNEQELDEVFGAQVIVQFREAIARVKPGEPHTYAPISSIGEPHFVVMNGQQGAAARDQIVPELLEPVEFTYILKARLAPAQAGRVSVYYECSAEGHIAMMLVRPSDIVAVTIVQAKSREERRIQAP